MGKLKKIKQDSVFTVKDESKETYNVSNIINAETGDSINPVSSSEYISSNNSAIEFLQNYASMDPSDISDIDYSTLVHYFGKNWDGNFPNCQKIVERRTSYVTTQLQWYNTIFDYISNPNLVPSGLTKYANIISQINGSYNGLITSVNGVNNCINNLKNFRFRTENPLAILNSTDYALANLQYMFTEVDGAVDHVVNIYNQMENVFNKVTANLNFDNVKALAESVSNKVQSVAKNIATNLQNLPATLMNKFINCSFVQNMFTLPLRVYGFVMNAISIVTTIRMPTNLKDIIAIFKILRKAVSEMKNAMRAITDAINQVKQVANMIKNGNWFGMLAMLNTQGSMNGFKIVEKPSSFAAKYPQNSAYTTAGGHTLEVDNTEGHERLHIEHKSGTSFEMTTDGDLLGKVKKDTQMIIDGNCEFSTKGNMQLQANKKLELTFKEVNFESAKDINMSGSNIMITSGLTPGNFITINGSSTLISSTETTTVSSARSTSVTGMATLELSSNGMILMDAPKIVITTNLLDILVAGSFNIEAGVLTSLVGSVTVLDSGSTNVIGAGQTNILTAPFTIIGGM